MSLLASVTRNSESNYLGCFVHLQEERGLVAISLRIFGGNLRIPKLFGFGCRQKESRTVRVENEEKKESFFIRRGILWDIKTCPYPHDSLI